MANNDGNELLIILIISLGLLLILDNTILYLFLLFIILNLAYSYFLKKIPILDMLIISSGYLFRVESGSKVIDVSTSYLTFCSIFFLSTFIISIKRKKELENNICCYRYLIKF